MRSTGVIPGNLTRRRVIVDLLALAIVLTASVSFLGYLLISEGYILLGMAAFVALWSLGMIHRVWERRTRFRPRRTIEHAKLEKVAMILIVIIAVPLLGIILVEGGPPGNIGPPDLEGEALLAERATYRMVRGEVTRGRFVAEGALFMIFWHGGVVFITLVFRATVIEDLSSVERP